MWRILRNFWRLGCESEQEKRRRTYTNLENSSDFPSSSSESSDRESYDTPRPDDIPKPDVLTGHVQPPSDSELQTSGHSAETGHEADIGIIDEDEIAGEITYASTTYCDINNNDKSYNTQ